MTDTQDAGARRLAVFAVADGKGVDGKSRWTRIGRAFDNQDGSINLLLNAFPIGTDRLQIREDREEERGGTGTPRRGGARAMEVRP
jgi:hypothetical protein